jgi:uncharacterized UBP type Zn finger protein
MPSTCSHLDEAAARETAVKPSGPGCQECLASGGEWVHLRLCIGCGHVGCCDQSPNRHATKHFRKTHHPVLRSYEPGEGWGYCYPDDLFAEDFPAKPGEAAPRHFEPPTSD